MWTQKEQHIFRNETDILKEYRSDFGKYLLFGLSNKITNDFWQSRRCGNGSLTSLALEATTSPPGQGAVAAALLARGPGSRSEQGGPLRPVVKRPLVVGPLGQTTTLGGRSVRAVAGPGLPVLLRRSRRPAAQQRRPPAPAAWPNPPPTATTSAGRAGVRGTTPWRLPRPVGRRQRRRCRR